MDLVSAIRPTVPNERLGDTLIGSFDLKFVVLPRGNFCRSGESISVSSDLQTRGF